MATKIIVYTKSYQENSIILKPFANKTMAVLPPIEKTHLDQNYLQTLKAHYQTFSPLIGFSGRIASEKGLEYLILALKKLKLEHPQIALICAGPTNKQVVGEKKYFQKIKNLAKKNQIPVFFLGTLNKKQLFAFYRFIQLLVLPSVNKTEAFGMVQVEAMLAKTPVIASNLPGVKVPIDLTGMGLLAKPKDSLDLSLKMAEILANEKQFRQRAVNVSKIFNPQRTYCFYNRLLNE